LGGGWAGTPRLVPESRMRDAELPPSTIPRSIGHHAEWIQACAAAEAHRVGRSRHAGHQRLGSRTADVCGSSSDQPSRYSSCSSWFAASSLVNFPAAPSHSSCLPVRMAMLPSSTNSVSNPATGKWRPGRLAAVAGFEPFAIIPRTARQRPWHVGELLGALFGIDARADHESLVADVHLAAAGQREAGRGLKRFQPPSYHTTRTGGMSSRAGNS
jgi:hypothetical protein